ncbi:5737_t:CDS:2 [Ambispora leptoticha]|uniref:5737_t:CDS:1 n=1 Tax=Ambispora leptoticha TaxID=144679 RepID=A0A9N9C921_9GLOM|nr:5737_t:CDS:2 [Ambispora leptoticha]
MRRKIPNFKQEYVGHYMDDPNYSPMKAPKCVFVCKKEAYMIGGELVITRRKIRTIGNWSDAITLMYLIFMAVALYIDFGNIRTSLGNGITDSGGDVQEQVRNGLEEGIKHPIDNSGHADRKIITLFLALVFQAIILALRAVLSLLAQCGAHTFSKELDATNEPIVWIV